MVRNTKGLPLLKNCSFIQVEDDKVHIAEEALKGQDVPHEVFREPRTPYARYAAECQFLGEYTIDLPDAEKTAMEQVAVDHSSIIGDTLSEEDTMFKDAENVIARGRVHEYANSLSDKEKLALKLGDWVL